MLTVVTYTAVTFTDVNFTDVTFTLVTFIVVTFTNLFTNRRRHKFLTRIGDAI